MGLIFAINKSNRKYYLIIKRSGKNKTRKIVLIVAVVLVIHMKIKSGGRIKREIKITLEKALKLLILMEFGTYCAIKVVVEIKPTPQYYMASKNPIHKCFHPNYLPLIPTVRILRIIDLICRHNHLHLRYQLLPELMYCSLK